MRRESGPAISRQQGREEQKKEPKEDCTAVDRCRRTQTDNIYRLKWNNAYKYWMSIPPGVSAILHLDVRYWTTDIIISTMKQFHCPWQSMLLAPLVLTTYFLLRVNHNKLHVRILHTFSGSGEQAQLSVASAWRRNAGLTAFTSSHQSGCFSKATLTFLK